MKKKLLLFTATYNEQKNIKIILKQIEKLDHILDIKYDILIIDDNSNDGTKEFLDIQKKKTRCIKVVHRNSKLGLNTAHIYAFQYAKSKNYKYLITFDSDLQHEIKNIPKFYNNLKFNNFVIGSRYMIGGKSNLRGLRFFISFWGNAIIKLLFASKLNEFTTSYRGFDSIALSLLSKNKIYGSGYSFFMEVVNLMIRKKVKIKEIPINFLSRKHGISKLPKIEILRSLITLIGILIRNYKFF